MEDENKALFAEKPYSYKLLKDKTALIRFKGKDLMSLSGKDYNKLLRVIDLDNQYEVQLFLDKLAKTAKAAGN